MDKTTKWIVGFAIFFCIILILAGFEVVKRSNECTSRSGILVKSTAGYVCVDQKVLL